MGIRCASGAAPGRRVSRGRRARRAKENSPWREPWEHAGPPRASPGTGRKKTPHSLASLLIHIIFSTKNRLPHLSPALAGRLFSYLGGILRERKSLPLIINGPADHVHLLVAIPPAESPVDLLRVVKTNSSRWVHQDFPALRSYGWQAGYAAFSVSASRSAAVTQYIAMQREHHRRISFQEEFLTFLSKHGVAYDERDLWG